MTSLHLRSQIPLVSVVLCLALVGLTAPSTAAAPASCTKVGAARTVNKQVQVCTVTKGVKTWVTQGDACQKLGEFTFRLRTTYWCNPLRGQKVWQALPPAGFTAFESVRNAFVSAPNVEQSFAVQSAPLVKDWQIRIMMNNLSRAAGLFSSAYLPNKPFPVLFASPTEAAWLRDAMVGVGLDPGAADQLRSNLERFVAGEQYPDYIVSGGSIGLETNPFITYTLGTSSPLGDLESKALGPHEWMHAVQRGAGGDLPCWFVEGSAQYYGVAVASMGRTVELTRRSFSAERDKQLKRSFGGSQGQFTLQNPPPSGWLAWLESHGFPYDSWTCGPEGGFTVGLVATEYLLSLKGHQGLLTFMAATKSQPWQNALANTYGRSASEMLTAIAEYIALVARQQQASQS